MHRRTALALVGVPTVGSLAGCTGLISPSRPAALADVTPDRQLAAPTLGNGPVVVEVYEDLGCPSCHRFQAEVGPTLETELIEPGEITYQHRDFVVEAADQSLAMANAARAVQDATATDEDPTGEFFGYKDAVIGADDWDDDSLADLATTVDVNPETVSTALEATRYYPTLAADWDHGEELGVSGTPTVAVDGDPIDDPFDEDAILATVENAANS